jgi:hypothetical protein
MAAFGVFRYGARGYMLRLILAILALLAAGWLAWALA